MKLKSARFKIMAWYIFILAVTLSVFSLLIYGNFERSIYDDLDELLSSRVEGVVGSVTTYMKLHEELSRKKVTARLPVSDDADFVNLARDWVEVGRKDPELMSIFVQILDHNGKAIISSKLAPRLEAIDKNDMDDILAGEESFDIIKGETLAGKKTKFRIYSRPVKSGGKTVYVVQAISPINLLLLALNNLSFVLFLFLPITVLLAGIPGIFLVKIALNPVDKMITTLKNITAENLKLRIHIPDTKDEIRRLADTFNDMLDRLERSLACQESFVEEISSKLKGPLASLKKDMGEIVVKEGISAEFRKILTDSLGRVEIITAFVKDLGVLAGFDEGNIPLEIRKTDITKIAQDAVKEFSAPSLAKDIELVLYSDPSVIIDCDKTQIRKLLNIVFDNAVKYTNRNGKIVVTVKKLDKDVKISVSDTGVGMPAEELPYIFDRFYQIKSGRRNRSGFGIGLSVAKAIVEAHKGKIEVDSLLGRGSVFTIYLPLFYPG